MRKVFTSAALLAVMSLLSTAVHAEYFALPSGRSGDLSKLPDVSVEGGYVTGDFGELDYSYFGARINYRINPKVMVYGDIGEVELADVDDTGFGVGAFYQLGDVVDFGHSSFKIHYHEVSFDRVDRRGKIDFDIVGAEWVIGGKEPLSSDGMHWYANFGIHRLSGEGDSDTELGFGGGVILPLGSGEAYFGIDHIDELTFGGGFRYTLR